MKTFAHDVGAAAAPRRTGPQADQLVSGLVLAVVSATSFGVAGPVARGLLDTGWTAGAAVLARVAVAAIVVLPFGLVALRGRWSLLRPNLGLIAVYGTLAVAGAQFCFFMAVSSMQVGPALLIEYTAPAAIVAWLWVRHGERPGRVTLLGALLAVAGLVLVLDLLSGADLSLAGVLWALAAMVGASTYFLVSADQGNGLPPLALASGGLVAGSLVLATLGLVGLMPMAAGTSTATYAGFGVVWWVPVLVLGLVSAATSYVTGGLANRRLGSRLASFVALLEVLAAVVFAWLLLDELPGPVQLAGGVLVLAGVVTVKLGEQSTAGDG